MRRAMGIIFLGIVISLFLSGSAEGLFIDNIEMPIEIKNGDKFTVEFDASYIETGEVYARIGLCDLDGELIRDKDGYPIVASLQDNYFFIMDDPIHRSMECQIKGQELGKYKLFIAIYDANTGDTLYGASTWTQPFTLVSKSNPEEVEEEPTEVDTTLVAACCVFLAVIIIGVAVIVAVIIAKRSKRETTKVENDDPRLKELNYRYSMGYMTPAEYEREKVLILTN